MLLDDLKKKAVSVAAFATHEAAQGQLMTACRKLLSEQGEASGATRAPQTLALYAALDSAQRLQWFDILEREFARDVTRASGSTRSRA